MKLEDQAGAELAAKGALGKVTFLRYSLTVNQQYQNQQAALLSEACDWLKAAGVTELRSVSASYGKGKQVLLVTMAFADVLANLFINMESQQSVVVKKTEIAGTNCLYVFDSASEPAFQSDCIPPVAYQLEAVNPLNYEWLNVINTSLITGEMEVLQ